jgi:hypothetical protein
MDISQQNGKSAKLSVVAYHQPEGFHSKAEEGYGGRLGSRHDDAPRKYSVMATSSHLHCFSANVLRFER